MSLMFDASTCKLFLWWLIPIRVRGDSILLEQFECKCDNLWTMRLQHYAFYSAIIEIVVMVVNRRFR